MDIWSQNSLYEPERHCSAGPSTPVPTLQGGVTVVADISSEVAVLWEMRCPGMLLGRAAAGCS